MILRKLNKDQRFGIFLNLFDIENVKRNIEELLRAERHNKLQILQKHSKKIELKREISYNSVERQNKFLVKKLKLDEKNKRWKSKIISKHQNIIEKVNDINFKKNRAVKIVQQLELINRNIDEPERNRDLTYTYSVNGNRTVSLPKL